MEGRAAKNGDTVVFDFEGFVDDKAFDGGKAEKFSLTLGSGQFIPGFEEQVAGHEAGEEFEVNVTFPEPSIRLRSWRARPLRSRSSCTK